MLCNDRVKSYPSILHTWVMIYPRVCKNGQILRSLLNYWVNNYPSILHVWVMIYPKMCKNWVNLRVVL